MVVSSSASPASSVDPRINLAIASLGGGYEGGSSHVVPAAAVGEEVVKVPIPLVPYLDSSDFEASGNY